MNIHVITIINQFQGSIIYNDLMSYHGIILDNLFKEHIARYRRMFPEKL